MSACKLYIVSPCSSEISLITLDCFNQCYFNQCYFSWTFFLFIISNLYGQQLWLVSSVSVCLEITLRAWTWIHITWTKGKYLDTSCTPRISLFTWDQDKIKSRKEKITDSFYLEELRNFFLKTNLATLIFQWFDYE